MYLRNPRDEIFMRLRLTALILLCLFIRTNASGQRRVLNMPDHDQKPYYFGITFGVNYSNYRIKYDESFARTDSFSVIQPHWGPGFNLGIMANLRVSNFIDLRFIPSLSFAEKKMTMTVYPYGFAAGASSEQRSIESVYMHLPLQMKFKSDRINNFRFYGMLGGKIDFDLAANARSRRSDEWLKVKPFDVGYEIGVGFEFYYPNFIFAPEIKLSQGLNNQLFKDGSVPLTNAIDRINTRTIVISIHLQG